MGCLIILGIIKLELIDIGEMCFNNCERVEIKHNAYIREITLKKGAFRNTNSFCIEGELLVFVFT